MWLMSILAMVEAVVWGSGAVWGAIGGEGSWDEMVTKLLIGGTWVSFELRLSKKSTAVSSGHILILALLLMRSLLILTNADVPASFFFGPVVCSSFAALSSPDHSPLSPLLRLHNLHLDFLTLLRAIYLAFTLSRRSQIDPCYACRQFRHLLHSPHYRRFLPRFSSSDQRRSHDG